jgi:hypothetical protein
MDFRNLLAGVCGRRNAAEDGTTTSMSNIGWNACIFRRSLYLIKFWYCNSNSNIIFLYNTEVKYKLINNIRDGWKIGSYWSNANVEKYK